MPIFLLILFAVFSAGDLAADEELETLTLEKSVVQGLNAATDVLKATNLLDATGSQLLQAYGQFLPNVQAIATLNYTTGNNYFTTATPTLVTMNNYGANIAVSSTLNLFNGLSDFASLKAAMERDRSSHQSLFRAQQQIVIDVTQAYLQVILDRHLVQIAEKNLAASKQRQSLLKEQAHVGVRSIADLFRQEAQTSADQTFVIQSKNNQRVHQLGLLRRLRLDIEKNYTLEEPNLAVEGSDKYSDEFSLIRSAIQNRADLRAAEANFRSTDWMVTTASSGYFPRFDLGFSIFSANRIFFSQIVNNVNVTPSYQAPFFDQFGDHTNYAVGITLTWNIFDRFLTAMNVQKAKVDARNADIDAQDRKLQVLAEIRQAYGDYQAALQQLGTAKIGLESAKKSYDTVEGRYKVGAANIVDLLTAQTALVQAETAEVQAVIGLNLQDKLVEFFAGNTSVEKSL